MKAKSPNLSLLTLTIFLIIASHFIVHITGKKALELNSNNIDKYINGEKFVFVFFYASWHAHCQKVLGIFDEVVDAFEGRNDVIIGKVNAYEDVKLATRFWVDRYPIFRYFVKGSKTEETYKGGHRADDFIRFTQARSAIVFNQGIFKSTIIELDASNFERIVKDRTKNLMIFYYNGNCKLCEQMEYTYHQVGKTFRNEPDCVLARVDCDAHVPICMDQLIPHYPTIKIYTTTNKDGRTYEPGKRHELYSERNLTMFMNALCKTQRVSSGRLNSKAGRLEEFDKLAVEFMQDWHRREQILLAVQEKTATHGDREYAAYYAIVMIRIMREGGHVLGHEIERLERLIAGQIHANKADELEKRKNILQHFHVLHHERDEL